MARPRNFDEDRAVEAAMHAFWTAGYEATSTQDLCAATGLGRSSIYNTFRSKHDLFERALRRYMEIKDASTLAALEGEGTFRERIAGLLRQMIEEECRDGIGCLVVNSGIELAPRDPVVAGLLRRNYERRLETLRAVIEEARLAGEIDAGRDARELAHFVIATISGIRVAARSGAGREALEAVAESALRAL
ncbi:TetR/AcrR family transcriptional regulator [Spirillospora sp. NPDC029432]|uniref:TetR/AcrR family transcriptional regulator n=1 Tax=Spirillospora sp. NPDC029432 TaxID=3154599 RepID=UPI003454F321